MTRSIFYNLGSAHHKLQQEEKALDFGGRALAIYQKLNNQKYVADTLMNLGLASSSFNSMGQTRR